MQTPLPEPISYEHPFSSEVDLPGSPELLPAVAVAPVKVFVDHRAKDQELFAKWQATGSKKDLGALVSQLHPIIYSEVYRARGTLPPAALAAEATKWAVKGIQTYDPSKGTILSTHVTNYLQKVRRMNYKYQNAVRLPENMQLKYHEYNRSLTQLTDELNRDPTDDELAARLGWSKAHTTKFKSRLYADLTESGSDKPVEVSHFNDRSILMQHLLSTLSAEEKTILNASKNMSSTQLAEKLGVNVNRLNYLKKKLVVKIQQAKDDLSL
jgi:DNA-directed RNA polymerase specialized sigma subunit